MKKKELTPAEQLLAKLDEQLITSGNILVYQPATPSMPPFRLCTVEELVAILQSKK